jgi:Smg protein
LAIVSLIAQYFLEDTDLTSESDLIEELLSVGFESDEIDAAFSWMENQALYPPAQSELLPPMCSNRIFSAEEKRVLDLEARGFLTRLRDMGILNDEAQEEIILKALHLAEEDLSLKEIKTITVLTLFARAQNDWCREFDCLLEDNWSRLLN